MSNAVPAQLLDLWAGSHPGDADARLLARFVAGRDEDAFAALVRRHAPLVYGTCQRILGNRADADDAFQAVFFVLARRAVALKPERGIGPWLHGVALRVATKHRGQIVRRRLREMSAAKSERVDAADHERDFWAVIDEELARMPTPQREVVLLCDLGGQSHAQAAESLGLAKGTVTKRLAKAREELAARLRRRGITLGVGALSTLIATRATAAVPAALVAETARQAVAFSVGPVGSAAAQSLAEGVMRSIKVGVLKAWLFAGLLAVLAGGGFMLAGDPAGAQPEPPKAAAPPDAATPGTMWKENYAVEFTGCLPVSVAFSADGKTLLTGDTNGEVMALIFDADKPMWRWKAKAEGSHAAVAFSADQKTVYATTTDGVRVLGETDGKDIARVEAKGSNPTALGVFPNKVIAETYTRSQIVFGNARGYFVKSWADRKLADTIGTIETSTTPKGAKQADNGAVPLAVDPKGRSAIMTGPVDPKSNKNVLWAYVCGDYSKDSPGNRVMVGHTAAVGAAVWAKEGTTVATGDADGRVIVWDAKTMKEVRRVELGGRVLGLALSDDGTRTAACVRGKLGCEFRVWDTAKPVDTMKLIHTELADFGSEPSASLSFSPDGARLAGCALDKKWLQLFPKPALFGKVRVWELAAEPKAQLPPKPLYTLPLPKGTPPTLVILDNTSMLTPASSEGAIDFRAVRDGGIQARLGLGKFAIGRMVLSTDRKWLAMEQHAPADPAAPAPPGRTFEVGVWDMTTMKPHTIPACSQLLDIASGGKVAAVVREGAIELWDAAAGRRVKAAPFKHTRIDAARFSPDGKLLAVSDRNALVLWRWEGDTHERIDLGRVVGSLAFSPDGRFLAEGPSPRENVQVRDVETRKVVRELANGTKHAMDVPMMAYAQSGRVLIGCDNIRLSKEIAVPHRITLWDTATGAVAHQLAVPSGVPVAIDVTPNGRHLVATIDDGEAGVKLSAWRLDGVAVAPDRGPTPPASGRP